MFSDALKSLRSSISAKAAFIVVLPVMLIMAFHTATEYRHDRNLLFQYTEMDLLRIAEGLLGPAETFIGRGADADLRHLVADAGKGANINLIALFSPNGTVLASNKVEWIGQPLTAMVPREITEQDLSAVRKAYGGGYSLYFDAADGQYCLAMPLRHGAGNAALMVSLGVAELNENLAYEAVKDFVILIGLILLIGASVYFFFYAVFIKRVRTVAAAAGRLSQGDPKVRAEVSGSDEIADLAKTFNLLAEEVNSRRNNLEEMVASRIAELSSLYEVVSIISGSLELTTVLPRILDHVLMTLGEQKGVIILMESGGTQLKAMAHRGLSDQSVEQIVRWGHGCVGDVILKHKPIRPLNEEGDEPSFPGLENENVRSILAVPLSVRGETLGALAVYSQRPDRFSDQDEALTAAIGNQMGVAIENARLYERTLELANEDGLTKLANRRRLMELLSSEIAKANRYHTALSALIMDLDKFKRFNDTYGHQKGDDLLRGFGALIKQSLRSSDIAGRYGGEEFAVVLPNTSLKGAQAIAERIRKATEEFSIPLDDGSRAGATVSIGIAELSEGDTDQRLFGAADAALYRAKEGGRNRVAW